MTPDEIRETGCMGGMFRKYMNSAKREAAKRKEKK